MHRSSGTLVPPGRRAGRLRKSRPRVPPAERVQSEIRPRRRDDDRLGARGRTERLQNGAHVVLDGRLRKSHRARDATIRVAAAEQAQHLELALGQAARLGLALGHRFRRHIDSAFGDALQRDQHARPGRRLRNVAARPRTQRLAHRAPVVAGRKDDDRRLRVRRLDPRKRLEAAAAGKPEVEHDQLRRRLLGRRLKRLLQRRARRARARPETPCEGGRTESRA